MGRLGLAEAGEGAGVPWDRCQRSWAGGKLVRRRLRESVIDAKRRREKPERSPWH